MEDHTPTSTKKYVQYMGASDEQVKWGACTDPRPLMQPGEIFEIGDVHVHSWHTKFSLKGIDGLFNSVCFEDISEHSIVR